MRRDIPPQPPRGTSYVHTSLRYKVYAFIAQVTTVSVPTAFRLQCWRPLSHASSDARFFARHERFVER